jgi:hypothetical protein
MVGLLGRDEASDLMWGKNLLTAVQNIADEAYQRRAWFGLGPEVSSPSEVFNCLFDDTQIEDFLANPPTYASRASLAQLARLRDAMDDLLGVDDDRAEALIDSAPWAEIRQIARTAADLLAKDLKPI